MAVKTPGHCACSTQQEHIQHLLRATCDSIELDGGCKETVSTLALVSAACGHIFHPQCSDEPLNLDWMTDDKGLVQRTEHYCDICGDEFPTVEVPAELRAALRSLLEEAAPDFDGQYDLDAIFDHESLREFDGDALAFIRDRFETIIERDIPVALEVGEEEVLGPDHYATAQEFVDAQFTGVQQHEINIAIAKFKRGAWIDVESVFRGVTLAGVDPGVVVQLKAKFLVEHPLDKRPSASQLLTPSFMVPTVSAATDTKQSPMGFASSKLDADNMRVFIEVVDEHTTDGVLDIEGAFGDPRLDEIEGGLKLQIKAKFEEECSTVHASAMEVEDEPQADPEHVAVAKRVFGEDGYATLLGVLDDYKVKPPGTGYFLFLAFQDERIAKVYDASQVIEVQEAFVKAPGLSAHVEEVEDEAPADPEYVAVAKRVFGEDGYATLMAVLDDYKEEAPGTGYHLRQAFEDARISQVYGEDQVAEVLKAFEEAPGLAANVERVDHEASADPEHVAVAKRVFGEDGYATLLQVLENNKALAPGTGYFLFVAFEDDRIAKVYDRDQVAEVLKAFEEAPGLAANVERFNDEPQADPEHVAVAKRVFGEDGYATLMAVLDDCRVKAPGVGFHLRQAFEDVRISQAFDEDQIGEVKTAFAKVPGLAANVEEVEEEAPADPPVATGTTPHGGRANRCTPGVIATTVAVTGAALAALSQIPGVQEAVWDLAARFQAMTVGES